MSSLAAVFGDCWPVVVSAFCQWKVAAPMEAVRLEPLMAGAEAAFGTGWLSTRKVELCAAFR
jgi:hypothetical protein